MNTQIRVLRRYVNITANSVVCYVCYGATDATINQSGQSPLWLIGATDVLITIIQRS